MIVQARKLRAPFPWFGGKSQVAHIVWERFGSDKRGRANAERERIWFSPHCLKPGREALLWTL